MSRGVVRLCGEGEGGGGVGLVRECVWVCVCWRSSSSSSSNSDIEVLTFSGFCFASDFYSSSSSHYGPV
jgi:hypothetical protein